MNRIWSFLIALAAIVATVLLLTVKDPYANDADGVPAAGPAPAIPPPPVTAPSHVSAEEAPPVAPSWFGLRRGEGLAVVLTGTVHDSVLKNRLVEAARREAPELVTIVDQMTVDPAARELPRIDHLPDLVAALIRGLREPGLRIEEGFARIEGSGAVERMLDAIRGALVGGLLDGTHGAMELIIVDRKLTLKGEVPDEAAREKLMALAKPARDAGYAMVDALTVK